MRTPFVLLAVLLLGAASAGAQTYQPRPYNARQAKIRRQNYAQQEAIRLLFGPQGIPALTRPSDPWNAYRPRYYYYSRPNYHVSPPRLYYR
jgi:hypothetical protein